MGFKRKAVRGDRLVGKVGPEGRGVPEGWYEIGDSIPPLIHSFVHTLHVRNLESRGEDGYVM